MSATPYALVSNPENSSARVVLGVDMLLSKETWHWLFVFPLPHENNKARNEQQADPIGTAKQIFKEKAYKTFSLESKFTAKMTQHEFTDAVSQAVVEILTSARCGFELGHEKSVDGDEAFLTVRLPKGDSVVKIASWHEYRHQLKPEAYPTQPSDVTCPTMELKDGYFVQSAKKCPAYVRYQESMKDSFQPFTETDHILLIRRRMNEFFSPDALVSTGVCAKVCPVHDYNALNNLYHSGWSNPIKFWRMMSEADVDQVRDYFGEEVAFFYYWLSFYNRRIAFLGILGLLCFFRRFIFEENEQRYIAIGFGCIMIIWAALFNAHFKQNANRKNLEWGTFNYDQSAMVRPQFRKHLRGTFWESLRHNLHWVLAGSFMIETLLAVYFINMFRSSAHYNAIHHPESTMYGLAPATAAKVAKYLITINIKVVDTVWGMLSPYLSKNENWKTNQQCKAATINKLFVVKFVIYYYPFFYIAFVQEHIEGCGLEKGACLDLLSENLVIFFATHIATVLAMLVVGMLMTYFKIKREISDAKTRKPEATYTYLQAQAKMADYPGDTDAFMELVLSLGFVLMFSVILPVMAFAAFVSSMLEKQFLAYKLSFVTARPPGVGQEGISSWANIIQVVSYIGVICNVALAVFQMHPFRDYTPLTKVLIFIFAENVFLFIIEAIRAAIPEYDVVTEMCLERHAETFDEVCGETVVPCKVSPTKPVNVFAQAGAVP
eukprot:TRINITY_DN101_c1_g1_i1.p1 TRINITY_DN101_c1_g1~~TRINITY_DN101_c1_g1_i1.p1  ORF type:complete len:719 (-),score=117.90 TRINITY_DN101_c1_g1_i1:343-2499(-)